MDTVLDLLMRPYGWLVLVPVFLLAGWGFYTVCSYPPSIRYVPYPPDPDPPSVLTDADREAVAQYFRTFDATPTPTVDRPWRVRNNVRPFPKRERVS